MDKIKIIKIKELNEAIKKCNLCGLCDEKGANKVIGEGNTDPLFIFIGEAPGKEELKQKRPFVGQAGKILDELLSKTGIKREDSYITNLIKCGLPGIRDPKIYELKACSRHLEDQLEILKPKIICTLGRFAAFAVLKIKGRLENFRGKIYKMKGYKLIPLYHPAYLLYNRQKINTFLKDLNLLKDLIEEEKT